MLRSNKKVPFCLQIEIAPNKPYFGTETGYFMKNVVAYLIFRQNAK